MNQVKIGNFFKELRTEKHLTQEQFAEIMSVSNRTVSRWETGTNLPDLDILIQIADYYEVEIGEIIDGERKNEKMNKEIKETTLKVADYSNEERKKITKRLHLLFLLGALASAVFIVFEIMGIADSGYTEAIASFALGFSFAMLVVGVIVTSNYMIKISKVKERLLNK